MKRLLGPFYFCFGSILMLFGCKNANTDHVLLVSGWEYAIPDSSLLPDYSERLAFHSLGNISELTAVHSSGGVIILRKIFDLDRSYAERPVSLMLGRIVKADCTYLNRSFLGSTGSFPPSVTNPWNINRIYAVPKEILRAKGNELLVKIYFEPGRGGIFDNPVIGDRNYLENLSKLRTFYYVDTYKISSVVSFLAAIIFFLIFLKRRKDRKFLYFSIAVLSFAIWGTYHFIWSLPFLSDVAFFDSLIFHKILWIALFTFGYYNSIFLYEFLERHKYNNQLRIIQALLAVTILGLVVVWSPQWLENFRKIALLGTWILAGLTIFWIVTAIRDKVPYAKTIFSIFIFFTILCASDVLIDVFNLYLPYFTPVAIPIYLSGLGLVVLSQYVNANNEVERISKILDVKNVEIASKNIELSKLDKLKDQFLANTSHELRTPLNGIIGIAESLMDGATGQLQMSTIQNLDMIVNSGKRLTALIGDILDFSQIKNDKLNLYSGSVYMHKITELVIALSNPLLKGKSIRIINEIDDSLPPIYGDDKRIEQIMFNLIGNAIKFTNFGEIKISGEVDGEMVKISVSDTGIGIPEDKLDDIFNSFEQLETSSNNRMYQGTGLGLSITKKIIELHGGHINVISVLGKGSTFWFTLPKGDPVPEKKNQSEAISSKIRLDESSNEAIPEFSITASPEHYCVLVIDDEPINLQVLTNQLKLNNYLVKTALSGEEALDLIKNEGPPDLIVLDVMMPKMSGFDTCRILREDYPASNMPIILLTAKDRISDLTEGFSVGANDYLIKPFSKKELLTRIKTHLSLSLINKAYSRFVPNEFLKLLNKESIIDIKLGDQTQYEMTVMFSDIRDFTSLSEQMTPGETFEFLNGYLEQIGPIIRSNNGFIDKYIGDAIMALFPGGPDDALKAAISIKRYLAGYNEIRSKLGYSDINIGIGIHTGSTILGTVGEVERMESTVISDTVNLASRLEGLTKYYGVPLLISQSTFEKLNAPHTYQFRRLDKVRVKGKKNSVVIIEVFDGDPLHVFQLKESCNETFEDALNKYTERRFAEAQNLFMSIINLFPADTPSRLYYERCVKYETYGIPPDIELEEVMNEK